MEVKDAVTTAKRYVSDLFAEEDLTNLGLEEIDFDESSDSWNVTLGFSRPWNSVHNTLTALTGDPRPSRTYKLIKIRDSDGKVISVTRPRYDD